MPACRAASSGRPSILAAIPRKWTPTQNVFSGSRTANRLVLTIGKFSVTDIFDNNKYAHDPENDFMNWALIDTATFDYAADAWGYSYGAAAEWYQGDWTFRGGIFDQSTVPNSAELDTTFAQFQWVGEIERRYQLWGQPGKLAVTGFLTRARMGTFADAIALAQATGGPPSTASVRQYRSRGGLSLNLEQQITEELGVFARAGFANGDVEPFDFIDVDRTAAAGLSLSGKRWGRPDDTFGLAGIVNAITSVHEQYFNDGGLGILIGDGMLPHPGPEQILETYYELPVSVPQARRSIINSSSIPATTKIAARLRSSRRGCTRNSNFASRNPHLAVTSLFNRHRCKASASYGR